MDPGSLRSLLMCIFIVFRGGMNFAELPEGRHKRYLLRITCLSESATTLRFVSLFQLR